jgi:hypothetical protein
MCSSTLWIYIDECLLRVYLANKGLGSHFVLLCFRHLETFLRNDQLDLFELLTHIGRRCTAYDTHLKFSMLSP